MEMAKAHDTSTTVAKEDGGPQVKKSPPATPIFKKRHKGCSFCILDIENAPLPTFPPNEVVVGVITMEDVIEELLQVRCFNVLYGYHCWFGCTSFCPICMFSSMYF